MPRWFILFLVAFVVGLGGWHMLSMAVEHQDNIKAMTEDIRTSRQIAEINTTLDLTSEVAEQMLLAIKRTNARINTLEDNLALVEARLNAKRKELDDKISTIALYCKD